MKRIWHKIEVFVDKSIPYALVALLFTIGIHFFFKDIAEQYAFFIDSIDQIVIGIFIIDLVFKYIRSKSMNFFFKHYWLEILAVFPFYVIFRVIEPLLITTELTTAQSALHTGLEIEKEGSRIVREVGSESRYYRLRRVIRPVLRMPRFLRAIPFFDKPTKSHKL